MMYAPTSPKSSLVGWLVFITGALFYSYEFLLRILPSVMTAELMQVHGLTTAGFGYLIVIYYVIYVVMQLPVGLLIDKFGPKRLLVFASATCAIGSFLFASETSVVMAGIGRFLIGLGSAFGFIGVLRLASLWLPAKRFALATGLVTTLGMIGGVMGEVGLSYVVDGAGWHTALLISAWVGVALVALFWFIPEWTHHSVSAVESSHHWRTLLQQTLSLSRMPIMWVNGIVGCLLYVPLSAFGELWGVSYLQSAQALSRVEATLAASWLMWGWALGAPFAGWLADKTGNRRRVILVGSALAITTILIILHNQFAHHAMLYALLFLFGIFCSGQILIMVIVRDVCPPAYLATGLALTNTIIMAGGMVFQPLVGVLLQSYSAVLMHNPTAQIAQVYYSQIMYIIPLVIALAMILVGIQVLRRDRE